MWQRIKALFRKNDDSLLGELARSPVYTKVREDVQAILESPVGTSAEREAIDARVVKVLEQVGAEVARIRDKAGIGQGTTNLAGDDWVAGIGCADQACALYEHFDAAGWTERAEIASAIWAQAVLSVCSHYHHMVGPAMIANARCHEALGNLVRADGMYRAVLGDFEHLIDDLDAPGELSDEERTAIGSLDTAVERLLQLGALGDRTKLETLRTKTQALLS